MKITPNDLDGWASELPARSELPVLLRKLAHARGLSLSHVQFPAYESTNDGGWDGEISATGTDPWIPEGNSFWELSCQATAKLAAKASSDIEKRSAATDETIRLRSAFVFATPRRWPGKTAWLRTEAAKGRWAEVRVYDADILSEWIEQAPAAQAFMAAQLGRPRGDLSAPETVWNDWSGVTDPRLTSELFAEAFAENRRYLERFFTAETPNPLMITGETREEAVAFIVSALLHFDLPGDVRERTVVLKSADGVETIRNHPDRLVLIAATPEAEGALGDLVHRHHVLTPADRSGADRNAGPSVEPLTWEAFRKAADALGLDKDDRDRLERDSGRRIALIRRQLSTVPELQKPVWASNDAAAAALIALAFAGGWDLKSEGDRAFLTAVGDTTIEAIEASIALVGALPEPPIFTVGSVGGIVSRADAFAVLRGRITKSHLARFFAAARDLLGEPDPALELEEDKRWAANLYGKSRSTSERLRQQVADTVAFLAVTGETLLPADFAVETAATRLVRSLFTETEDPFLHLNDILQPLAEAAPEVFLKAIEDDLPFEAEDHGVWKAIKPAGTGGFSSHADRTQVAWALERLAWLPSRFPRVARILVGLSTRPLTDNLINKPARSLYSSLHPWLPQTAAPLETRIAVLKALDRSHPAPAWDLAVDLMDQRLSHAEYAQRPRFRGDAIGHGLQPDGPSRLIMWEAQTLLLAREHYDTAQLLSLIQRLPCFRVTRQKALWRVVERWAATASAPDIALVRESIRMNALGGRMGRQRKVSPRARALYDYLQPTGPERHAWLFQAGWLDLSAEDLEDDDITEGSVRRRDERIAVARASAVAEVWAEGGLDGVIALAGVVNEPWVVGSTLTRAVPHLDVETTLDTILSSGISAAARKSLLGGLLIRIDRVDLLALLTTVVARQTREAAIVELLVAAPVSEEVWSVLDAQAEAVQQAYWRACDYRAFDLTPEGFDRLLTELVSAQRPLAAFHQLYLEPEKASTATIVAVLRATAYQPGEENGHRISSYEVERCFEALDKRDDISTEDLAVLEFAYASALDARHDGRRGLKALSFMISRSPETFVAGISAIYRDGREERVEGYEPTPAERQTAENWHHIFGNVAYGPGGEEDGEIDAAVFQEWMERVTPLLEACGRLESGLHTIGEIVGRTRLERDGVWPPTDLANALEAWADSRFGRGLYFGIVNSRGAQWRSPGGSAERALALKYRGWAEPHLIERPRLAACFEEIARSYEHDAGWHDDRARLERTSSQ